MENSCPRPPRKTLLPQKSLIKLIYILDKTSLGDWMREQPFLFTGCSSIQFFNSLPFLKQNRLGQTWYPTHHLQSLCDLRDTIPGHWSPSACHPTFPRKQKFSLGVARILRICLCPHT